MQTTPLVQVQVPAPSDVVPVGQPLVTQVPELQVPVSLQRPPSFVGVVPQVPPLQTARLHASLPLQTVPQAPQLVGSPLRYVHVPLHDVEPAGQPLQTQFPFSHVPAPPLHDPVLGEWRHLPSDVQMSVVHSLWSSQSRLRHGSDGGVIQAPSVQTWLLVQHCAYLPWPHLWLGALHGPLAAASPTPTATSRPPMAIPVRPLRTPRRLWPEANVRVS